MPPTLAPSLLSANFANLIEDIRLLEAGGCSVLHLDVMDGHFVPNISFGPVVVSAVRKVTSLFLDTHLMIEEPLRYIESFAKAGSDNITIHSEANDPLETLKKIRELGKKAGISIRPKTPLESIKPFLDHIDLLLIMSVEPGFGGQEFIPESLEKTRAAKEMIGEREIILEIDGGIKIDNVQPVLDAGAEWIVSGSGVFGYKEGVKAACEEFGKIFDTKQP